eukprot:COSAG01_NODE_16097_length_1270_cov_2.502989_2_plen_122_part_00
MTWRWYVKKLERESDFVTVDVDTTVRVPFDTGWAPWAESCARWLWFGNRLHWRLPRGGAPPGQPFIAAGRPLLTDRCYLAGRLSGVLHWTGVLRSNKILVQQGDKDWILRISVGTHPPTAG